MSATIEFENISKQYKLGYISSKTLSQDLNRWWTMHVLRKEDPMLKIGSVNNRAEKADSDYVWALRDITFNVEQGDVVGIIGKNGAGKSTLLKLLSRVTAPTTGVIRARGRIASLLEVGTGFHLELTGRENIYMNGSIMGMTKAEIKRKFDEIVDFAGVERYVDTPVKRYSSGMLVRLGFAVAAHLDPEILVVDEVLAVGDAEFQKKAIGKMQEVSKGEGRTVLFVSHNMASIRALCKHGVLLRDGMVAATGGISEIVDLYTKNNNAFIAKGKISNKIISLTTDLVIKELMVNGQDTNEVELIYPNRDLQIQVSGHYAGKINMDMEVLIYDENNILVSKFAQSLKDGKTEFVNNSDFSITRTLRFPEGLTNGVYYLQIDLTHPKISYITRCKGFVKLTMSSFFTSQGIAVDRKTFGYIYI